MVTPGPKYSAVTVLLSTSQAETFLKQDTNFFLNHVYSPIWNGLYVLHSPYLPGIDRIVWIYDGILKTPSPHVQSTLPKFASTTYWLYGLVAHMRYHSSHGKLRSRVFHRFRPKNIALLLLARQTTKQFASAAAIAIAMQIPSPLSRSHLAISKAIV